MANELPAISQNIKELVGSMKGYVQKLGATIGGHFSDIMSEEMKMVNDTVKQGFTFAKDATLKTLAFFGKSFGIDWKTLKVQIMQLKMLKLITGQMERTEKSRLARFKGRSKDFLVALLELLGLSLVAVGAAAGAILGKFLLPFTLLAKTLKKLLPSGKALKALAKTGPIARLIKSFGWLGRIFTFFGKLWGIRHILRGLKFGFAKLVWPLQIIMSAIDFVKGYMDTEGTILDKIKGGLKNVILKFIEWPVEILTKMVNHIMNEALGEEKWKDIDSAELMKKISEKLSEFLDSFHETFKDMYDNLLDLIRIINDPSWKNLRNIWKSRKEKEAKRLSGLTKEEKEDEGFFKTVKGSLPPGAGLAAGFFKEELIDLKKSYVNTGDSLMKKLGEKLDSIGKAINNGNKEREAGNTFQKNKGADIITVPGGGSQPQTTIPDNTGDKRIEDQTSAEIGYTF